MSASIIKPALLLALAVLLAAWTHGVSNYLLDGNGGYLLDGSGGKLRAQ